MKQLINLELILDNYNSSFKQKVIWKAQPVAVAQAVMHHVDSGNLKMASLRARVMSPAAATRD